MDEMQPPSAFATVGAMPAAQLATQDRIVALNKAWKAKMASQRDAERAGSSSDTDSDSSSASETGSDEPASAEAAAAPAASAALAPAAMAAPRPSTTPRPAVSSAPVRSPGSAKLPANAAPCVSQTPVPLPEFLRPLASAKPSAAASPLAPPHPAAVDLTFASPLAIDLASASLPAAQGLPDAASSATSPSSASSASSGSSASVSDPLKRTEARDGAEPREARPASHPQPSQVKAGAHVEQAPAKAEEHALSSTSTPPAPPNMYHLTGGELLAQVRLSAAKAETGLQGVLLKAADGRPYSSLPGPDGVLKSGQGTLFPTNYRIDYASPQYICPVRDCRRDMPNLISLGGHFRAKHCSGMFNDNLDGTLGFLAAYKNPNGLSPAIIVSQSPLAADAPPAVEPMRAPTKPAPLRPRPMPPATADMARKRAAAPAMVTSDIAALAATDAASSTVCRYLNGFLTVGQKVPLRDDVRWMMTLPRRRPLPPSWIKHHRDTLLNVPMYAAALAYLVGDEVTGPGICTQMYKTGRLSVPCIALPRAMPAVLRSIFSNLSTCIGCFYRSFIQRQANQCKWARGGPDKSIAEVSPTPPLNDDGDGGEIEEPAVDSFPLQTPGLASTRSRRLKRSAADASAGPDAKAAKLSRGPAERPEAMLEMEAWEMAPGLLTEETGTENVAFSGAYLTSAQPIPILPDIGIHVIVAKPGSSKRWEAEANQVRACTVAAGKVRVRVGETAFVVGPNGSFSIKPGQTCLVENRFYFDATIHCFSVKDYALVSDDG